MGLDFDPIAEAGKNWTNHGWAGVDEMRAATSITRAHQIILARINEKLAPLDLTFSRYEALVLLTFSRNGSLPLGKIGERLQVHPTSVTNTIDRLEADGFVHRVPHPTDRRTTLAEITAGGTAAVQAATEALVDIGFGLGEASAEDLAAMEHAITSLRHDAGDF